jgi:5-methylcytosine-specific restriction protein A
MKITMAMSEKAYPIAKKVFSGQLTRNDGKVEINRVSGMNTGSAQAFITIFLAMMNGEEYKRAFNNETNKFLLESIRKDYGERYYANALDAVQKHINYYSTLGKGKLVGLQSIVNELNYSERL